MGTIHYAGPVSEGPGQGRSKLTTARLGRAAKRVASRLAESWASGATASIARCEPLENRQHFAVGPVVNGAEVVFYGTGKADKIEVSRNAEGLLFQMNGTDYQVNDAVTSIKILGLGGADYISVFDTAQYDVGDVTIDGGGGPDKIFGGDGNDNLIGGPGNDLIQGGNGNDTLDGGSGNDRLIGGRGSDNLIGAGGKNVYNAGNDIGDTDDAGGSSRNIQSTLAARPTTTEGAVPLQVFGSVTGLTPGAIRSQYAFGDLSDQTYTNRGAGQAVAVVIPYNVTSIYTSVNTFSTQFGLPQVDGSKLAIINASGTTPPADPDPDGGWESEAALQLEWIHAIAPLAQLYLVLADSDLFTDLFLAVDKAVDTLVSRHGGGVAVMSFGSQTGELNPSLQAYLDQSFTRKAAKNVTFVTGSGDASTVTYPSVSPYVVSVGGTSLQRDTLGGLTGSETGWVLSGGGQSATYPTPGFQTGTTVNNVQVARRATPDLSFNADPNSGLALYVARSFGDIDGDNTADSGWLPGGAGGTSAATPIAAGLIALANEQRAARQRGFLGQRFNDVIYDLNRVYPGGYFTDIIGGTSGTGANAKTAVAGYDLVTGNGTPKATLLIDRLASAGLTSIATDNVEWFGEFKEAINKIGSVQSAAGGFVVGNGAVAGNNQLSLVLTPDYSRTPLPPVFPDSGGLGTGAGNNIDPAQTGIVINNFQPVTMFRLDDNRVTGTGRVDVTLIIIPTEIPAPTDPTSPPPTSPPPGTPAPTPVPGFFVAGVDDSEPPRATGEIRTWRIDLNFSGKIYRDNKGRERIEGEFINRFSLYNPGGEPVEGLEPIFRGTFKA